MTAEPVRTVEGVLDQFGGSFSEFNAAFNEGQYVLWLGSGISRERVPRVDIMLERVLEHLRSMIVETDDACEFRVAFDEVLRLASLTDAELASLDLSNSVEDWPLRERIVKALATHYSSVLDVRVGEGRPADYLVWTGLDVPNTYGAPDLEPDVEHYCIAILMLEGLVTDAVTANWDGLLEKALNELTAAFESLVRVVVKVDDFREHGQRIEIIKFHGCAVLARTDESEYRGLLIARQSQISGWAGQQAHRLMQKQLEHLYTTRPTLMLGLSAQDANLHAVFAEATEDLARPWPSSPPAVVLSEERLESYHRNLLMLTYGEQCYEANTRVIAHSALLGAFGKTTLLALVLESLADKLGFLIDHVIAAEWGSTSAAQFRTHLRCLRDVAVRQADAASLAGRGHTETVDAHRAFIARLVDLVSLVLKIFRTGKLPDGALKYEPLSDCPANQAILNADFPAKQFGRLGVGLALIGRGVAQQEWRAVPAKGTDLVNGVVQLVRRDRNSRVFFAKDSGVLTVLTMTGSFDADDMDSLVIVADEESQVQTRSPSAHYGRDGRLGAGLFSVSEAISETSSPDELYEAFKLAGGL